MTLVVPDILAEALRLSFGAKMIALFLGLAVGLTGWTKRVFWIPFFITTGMGIYGLYLGRMSGTHPLVAAILLGLIAGILATELSKVFAFVTGGMAVALTCTSYVPGFPEPLLAYLAGGLVCILLFRFWVLALFGFASSIVLIYIGLPFVCVFLKVNPVVLATQKSVLLNGVVLAGTLAAIFAQTKFDTYLNTKADRAKKKAMEFMSAQEKSALEKTKAAAPKSRLFGLVKSKPAA